MPLAVLKNEIQTAFDRYKPNLLMKLKEEYKETKNALVSSFDQSVLERLQSDDGRPSKRNGTVVLGRYANCTKR